MTLASRIQEIRAAVRLVGTGMILVVGLVCTSCLDSNRDLNPDLEGVPEISLSPAQIEIPYIDNRSKERVEETWARDPIVRELFKDPSGLSFSFRVRDDLTYVRHYTGPADMFTWFSSSELYAVRGNEKQKLLSNVRDDIQGLDIHAHGFYLDRRKNLFVPTMDGTLFRITGSRVTGKITGIAKLPIRIGMFSDASATYLVVPKTLDALNCSEIFGGPRGKDSFVAIFRLNI
jgi:hypothetical protein